MLVIEFVEVKPDRNQINLQFNPLLTFSHHSFVPTVILDDAKGAFGLYRAVRSQQCAVDTFEVFQNLPVHGGQLLI